MKRFPWVAASIVLATSLTLASACTTHGQGGRCDPGNVPAGSTQNADCDNGLVCIPGTELQLPDGGGSPQGNFCCPIDRSTADPSNICYTSNSTIGDDAAIPADTGAPDTSTTDATTDQSVADTSTDSPSDAVSESSTDASDAGGE